VALCAFSVALCVTTVFFFHERREVYKVYKVDSKIRRFENSKIRDSKLVIILIYDCD